MQNCRMLQRMLAALALSLACAASAESPAPPSVTLATLDWPPYVGQDLRRRGLVHAIVEEALARSNLTLQARFMPWARSYELARKGQMAGVFPEYYDAGRAEEFIYSDPMPGGPIGLYKRREDAVEFVTDPRQSPTEALFALREYRFGVVRGYANTEAFDAAEFLIKDEATTDAINLKKLAYERIDLVVIDQHVANYLLTTELTEYADALEFMLPPLEFKPLYVAFSRAHPQAERYVRAFNAGLAQLRADGRLAALTAEFGF